MKLRTTLVSVGSVLLLGAFAEPAIAVRALPTYTAVLLNSPEPQAGSFFGNHMAVVGDIDGDGVPDIAVSSERQDSGAVAKIGVVWIFSGRTRQLIRTIHNPEPQPGKGFGDSILSIGDVNGDGVPDLMIAGAVHDVYVGRDDQGNPNTKPCGSPEPNGCNERQGAVWIISGKTGNVIRRIDDPTPQAGAFFGFGFAIAPGDLNGDGSPDFVVTAEGENVGTCDVNGPGTPGPCPVGAAYAFDGKTGALIHRFDDPDPEAYAGFGGGGTSSPGDVTGDGVGDIVIGASGANSGLGRAYLFDGRTGGLVRKLLSPGSVGGGFGNGIGSGFEPGDVNADGVPDLLVAAAGQDVGAVGNAGRLYLLNGKDGSVIRTLDDPNPKPSGSFGHNHASAGDLNGDGTPDIVASRFIFPPGAYAPDAPPGAAAYVFDGKTGTPLITLPGMTQDGPGSSLVSPGDINGDGYPDYLLGGRLLDGGGGAQSGQVIVELSSPPPGATTSPPGTSPGPGTLPGPGTTPPGPGTTPPGPKRPHASQGPAEERAGSGAIFVSITCVRSKSGFCVGIEAIKFRKHGFATVRKRFRIPVGRSSNVLLSAKRSERHRIRFTLRLRAIQVLQDVGEPDQHKNVVLKGRRHGKA